VVVPQGVTDDASVARLVSDGYDATRASRALVLSGGDFESARDFLLTGEQTFRPPPLGFGHEDWRSSSSSWSSPMRSLASRTTAASAATSSASPG
jgi:uncharacterized UBP type Zn finger protein